MRRLRGLSARFATPSHRLRTCGFFVKALTVGDEIRLRFCPTRQALNIVEIVTLRDSERRACEAPMPEKSTVNRGSARPLGSRT